MKKQFFTIIIIVALSLFATYLYMNSVSYSFPFTDSPVDPASDFPALTENVDIDKLDGPYMVRYIVDGDTLYVTGIHESIRLIGIDTPELGGHGHTGGEECFGEDARTRLAELLPVGSEVMLERDNTQSDRDRYGRLLRYVVSPSLSSAHSINEMLVRDGFAREFTFRSPYLFRDDFLAAQEDARLHARGLWSVCEGYPL